MLCFFEEINWLYYRRIQRDGCYQNIPVFLAGH